MKAVYPGSFDPVTCGHLDIIERASRVFDELVVAVAVNLEKTPFFSVEDRIAMLQEACGHLDNVRVDCFRGLVVEYADAQKAEVVIRGLRAVSDFEYELQIALTNKRLNDRVETLFIMTSAEHLFLSSSVVKELAEFGAPLAGLVPDCVERRLADRLKQIVREAEGG